MPLAQVNDLTIAYDVTGSGEPVLMINGIGAARDVIQNHLVQLMALTAMEEPVSFSPHELQAEKIKVLSADQRVSSDAEQALQISTSLFVAHGDVVDGVFTVCEPINKGMLRALENRNLAGKVKFVGFDSDPRFVEALKNKSMHGIILQDPVKDDATRCEEELDAQPLGQLLEAAVRARGQRSGPERRCAARDDGAHQAPPVELHHAAPRDEVGRQRVTGEAVAIENQHVVAGPGEQHRRGRARATRAHDDDVGLQEPERGMRVDQGCHVVLLIGSVMRATLPLFAPGSLD